MIRRTFATLIATTSAVTATFIGVGSATATDGIGPGSAINVAYGTDHSAGCTLGFVVGDTNGKAVALTAGHCGHVGDPVTDPRTGDKLGTVIESQYSSDRPATEDMALIRMEGGGTTQDLVPTPQGRKRLLGAIAPAAVTAANPRLCTIGITTGMKCGATLPGDNGTLAAYLPSRPGDSGGPVYAVSKDGVWAVGILIANGLLDDHIGIINPITHWANEWHLDVRGVE